MPDGSWVMSASSRPCRARVREDKDFGELAVVRRQPHAGIVRLAGLPTAQQAPVAAVALARYAEELHRGALVTAESDRTRVRPGDE